MRPDRLVLVCGTGTEIGKTWVAERLLLELRARGCTVAARKPAQSFDVDPSGATVGGPTDAEVLAGASGEAVDEVCPRGRSYRRAMAPPMAAASLGLPGFTVAELCAELIWPATPVDVGVVETAGGVRSPQADDGDATDLAAVLAPDLVLVVADAGLGTINGVRLTLGALAGAGHPGDTTVVVLNRYDGRDELHLRNRSWLVERDRLRVVALPGEEPLLADAALGPRAEPRP